MTLEPDEDEHFTPGVPGGPDCAGCGHPKREHYFGERGGKPHCCWGAFRDECDCGGYVR